jgi:transcriptional regulator with XRE-family HTH domain
MLYQDATVKRSKIKLTDQLRKLIDDSGLSQYQIVKETGIDKSALSRFCSGERGLSIEALNALGEGLDLELKMRRPAQRTKDK